MNNELEIRYFVSNSINDIISDVKYFINDKIVHEVNCEIRTFMDNVFCTVGIIYRNYIGDLTTNHKTVNHLLEKISDIYRLQNSRHIIDGCVSIIGWKIIENDANIEEVKVMSIKDILNKNREEL